MKPVHFVAFCKLLGLPHTLRNQYIWDLAKYTPLISRKRNFFRNFGDVEPVEDIPNFFNRNSGPLIDLKGHIIAFAPLLRTREVLKFGIRRSSWTLYQPHALVWDYSSWGGKEAFSSACKLGSGKVPCLCWDRLIPPPFLDDWSKIGTCEYRPLSSMRRDASRGGHQSLKKKEKENTNNQTLISVVVFRLQFGCRIIHSWMSLTIFVMICIGIYNASFDVNVWILWDKISFYVLWTCGLRVGGWECSLV